VRRVLLSLVLLLSLLTAAVLALRSGYRSWHPCDWLLQDEVARTLERRGMDPDTASVPLKAVTVGSDEVRVRMRGQHTPLRCAFSWALRRVRL
jgi:hypothetical protein